MCPRIVNTKARFQSNIQALFDPVRRVKMISLFPLELLLVCSALYYLFKQNLLESRKITRQRLVTQPPEELDNQRSLENLMTAAVATESFMDMPAAVGGASVKFGAADQRPDGGPATWSRSYSKRAEIEKWLRASANATQSLETLMMDDY